jgi:hypothetical protein
LWVDWYKSWDRKSKEAIEELTLSNQFAYIFYCENVNEFTMKTGYIKNMIEELEFEEIERNEFLYKMNMIENTVRMIQYRISSDQRKKQEAAARTKARSRGRR